MDTIEDEIEAIQAIYGGAGEFELIQKGNGAINSSVLRLNLTLTEQSLPTTLSLTLTLPPAYPNVLPEISITSSNLTRKNATQLKQDLVQHCQTILGGAMVMELVSWTQDHFSQYIPSGKKDGTDLSDYTNNTENLQTCLLHLDHMRARGRYVKTIQKWTEELGLTGRLVFWDKLIMILLQGQASDVKDYIQRQRTVNIDVDSKGRSCKERMLRVMAEQPLCPQHKSEEFLVKECNHAEDLCKVFTDMHLENICEEYVKPFLKR